MIQRYYRETYGRETDYFAYGTDLDPVADDGTLGRLGLEPGRLRALRQPARAREQRPRRHRGLPLRPDGRCRWRSSATPPMRATTSRRSSARTTRGSASSGAIYGHGYQVLRSHAAAYVQATEVGGTHPALVEAMGFGNAIVANDVPEHRETLADAGLYYKSTQELAAALTRIVERTRPRRLPARERSPTRPGALRLGRDCGRLRVMVPRSGRQNRRAARGVMTPLHGAGRERQRDDERLIDPRDRPRVADVGPILERPRASGAEWDDGDAGRLRSRT